MFELSRKARDRHLDAKRRYHTFNCERYCLDEDVGHPVPIANQLMKRNGFFHYRKVLQLPRGDRNSLIGQLQPRVVAKMENILSTLEPELRALGKQLLNDFQLDYAETCHSAAMGPVAIGVLVSPCNLSQHPGAGAS